MFQSLTFGLAKANPALREKAVRVWEDVRVDVQENGRHTDNRLRNVR